MRFVELDILDDSNILANVSPPPSMNHPPQMIVFRAQISYFIQKSTNMRRLKIEDFSFRQYPLSLYLPFKKPLYFEIM